MFFFCGYFDWMQLFRIIFMISLFAMQFVYIFLLLFVFLTFSICSALHLSYFYELITFSCHLHASVYLITKKKKIKKIKIKVKNKYNRWCTVCGMLMLNIFITFHFIIFCFSTIFIIFLLPIVVYNHAP